MSQSSVVSNPVDVEPTSTQNRKRSILPLVAMILLFGLPYPLAWYLVFSDNPVFELKQRAYGDLVSPMVATQTAALEPELDASIKNQWKMLYFLDAPCDAGCKKMLFLMQQARRAQGVERNQLARIVVVNSGTLSAADKAELSEVYTGTGVYTLSAAQSSAFIEPFQRTAGALDGRLFLLDPADRLMMYYHGDIDPKGLIGDLGKLVK